MARAVGSYEAAAASDVDAVYIATPPGEHRDHALLFIQAGKPVLIEKPLASTADDARAIIEAATVAKVFCMEGLWTKFLPALALARRLLAEGAIGAPRALAASFAIAEAPDPSASLFRPDLGGGALAHRGVYPIALAMDLLGPAALVSAAVTRGETGVDEEAFAMMRHAGGGAVSMIHAGARVTAANALSILGEAGALRLVGPIYRPFGVEITPAAPRRRGEKRWTRSDILKEAPLAQGLRQTLDAWLPASGRGRVRRAPYIGNGYAHEAMAVMEALDRGWTEHPAAPLAGALEALRLIDQIRAAGGGA